ncbi:MAG: GNVR domain-containing protein [Candidatus Delongbacteria bacterium]|jgi:uncharacterized protein involved in exopolysaccharide biosynthesis|nr:GNVR domain-containing protein [Candidatus Delongbacteria bacterium]
MEPIQQIKPQEHEVNLIEIITILWRARKFIATVTLVSLFIGILYILFAAKMYSGTITLYPAQSGAKNPMAQMAAQMGMAGASPGDANYNIPDVVKSRTLSEQIVAHEWEIEGYEKRLNLVDYFNEIWNVEKPEEIKTKKDEQTWYNRRLYSYSQLVAINRINVNSNTKTGLVTVSVLMEDPKLARDIANFISVFVANWVNDTQKESIRKNLEFINERAAVLGGELQEAENELKKFRETNRNILNSPDLQLELQRLQRQVTIKQEVYLTMIKQREINQIEENKSADVIRILDKAIDGVLPVIPNKRFVLIISILIGLVLSSMLTLLVCFLRRENPELLKNIKVIGL